MSYLFCYIGIITGALLVSVQVKNGKITRKASLKSGYRKNSSDTPAFTLNVLGWIVLTYFAGFLMATCSMKFCETFLGECYLCPPDVPIWECPHKHNWIHK